MRKYQTRRQPLIAMIMAFAIFAMPVSVFSQTHIKLHSNKYKITDDIQLGRQAAQEVEQQMPILRDGDVTNYVSRVGERLAASVPSQFRHPEFDYYFKVVNARDINAFALPGGPMYVNRGMIEAARTEGEMAGVMAHEISHVALRHGTAQATSGQKWAIGSAIGQIAGAILGGGLGQVLSTGSQIGAGLKMMQYGRDYERQADLLGAQIMARAGYDPRQMANMFRTIQAQGGSRGPEWMSSHPDPGNRYASINKEAEMVRVEGRADTADEFQEARG